MNKKKLTILLICNSLICLIIGAFIPLYLNNFFINKDVDPNLAKFMEVYDVIKDKWYFLDDGDEEEYINRALQAMVNGQDDDKYLQYTPAIKEDKNQFGIGISASTYDGYIIIKDVYERSPAKQAGLEKDMIIMKVNDQDIKNMTLDEVSLLISGPLNSTVNLTIKHQNKIKTYNVVRSTFDKQTVYGNIIDDVGIVRVTEFENKTYSQFDEYLKVFKNNNIEELIIDLRDNGGGYIYQFQKMADLFIDQHKVLGDYIYRNPKDNERFYTENGIKYTFKDIYILINENSASASESFSCALKDNLDNVTVLGLNSYGKGIAQKTISFTDGSTLKYTYAEYRRPNKNVNDGVVHKIGISPDIVVKDEGNYRLINKSFSSFNEAKEAYLTYFNNLLETSNEKDQLIINQGILELNNYNDRISFSNEVNNLISRKNYDERAKAFSLQLNNVIDIAKED